jgi:hypothetical protein
LKPGETTPPWLWRMTWIALLLMVVGGMVTIIVLSAGAANPPKAGPLAFEEDGTTKVLAVPGQMVPVGIIIPVPSQPYTLEVTSQFTADTDPTGAWGIVFEREMPQPDPFLVMLNGYQFLKVAPSKPDFTPFIHVRANGQPNMLDITTRPDGTATLRVNDEIAWTGAAPAASRAQIYLMGGSYTSAQLTVQRVAFYVASPVETSTASK